MKKSLTAIFLLWLGWAVCPGGVLGQAPALTLDQLKNATYLVDGDKIKLKNGTYQAGTIAEANYLLVNFETAALGDLNNDGKNDAAVIYFSNGGGSGSFVVLGAMLNQDGNPVQVASEDLGDRVVVKSLAIRGGKIVLTMLLHGPKDSMAEPTVKQTRTYRLAGDKLVQPHTKK
jgi:hypothetical protein